MTQENDSPPVLGAMPDKEVAPAKKAKPATKKATPSKATSGQTATPKKSATAAGEEKPVKKVRATAKSSTKNTAGNVAPKITQPQVNPADPAEEKPATAKKTVKPTRSPKAKTLEIPAPKPVVAPGKTAPPLAKKSKPARAKTAKPTVAPETSVVPGKRAETISALTVPQAASLQAVTSQVTEKPVAPQRSEQKKKQADAPSAKQDSVTNKAVEQIQLPSEEKIVPVPAQAETRAEGAPETPAKPASRRSRRGGRRRNKSKAAAQEKAARENAAQGTIAQEGATQALQPQEDSSLQDMPEILALAEMRTSEPAATTETATGDNGLSSRKSSRKAASSKKVSKDAEDKNADLAEDDEGKPFNAKRKMFISVLSGELVEVVLAEEGAVVEYYVEMQHQAKVKGNIYKGVVSNIDANLQAAFISYAGGVKNGFLQIDEIHPEYYTAHHEVTKGRKYPPIQKVLKPGQEILVQVVKEPAGTKGAFLTSYLSLPGRFLVLTPGREQIGVSRKVEIDEERVRLRGLLEGLKPGKGLGVIVRTASTGTSKTNLQRDLQFLKRLWKDVRAKGQIASAPGLIYEELDLSTRAIRDYLTDDVQDVWVDDAITATQVTELASLLFPKKQHLVHLHSESAQTLFERFSLQRQLDHIHSREVSLPSGGSLVIDKTEALTAIDINSGRSSGKTTFEDMAYRTNMEAAKAIPLQLRLRDIGGQIVADFIEMRDRDHWREVEKIVRNGMKGDRARYDVGKISPFGMLEIVRQRLGSSAISISTEACPCCKGTGIRRNMEWRAMQALRDVNKQLRQAASNNQTSMAYQTETELAFYLLNTKRGILHHMETEAGVSLSISPKTE